MTMHSSIGRSWACLPALFVGTIVHAQAPQHSSASESNSDQLEEIVVTAQKRAESIQDAPLAVSVISGDLLARGITSVSDLDGLAPSVQIQTNTDAINVSIRGVTTNSVNLVADTAIAYGFNGTPILHSIALPPGLYDLERIEVLRGPQGTLYGRSATGGAVNFITKRPTHELEGSVSTSYGDFDLLDIAGVLNVPLGEKLALRAVGQRTRHDGYLSAGYNDQDDRSARLSVLFEPTTDVSIVLGADYGQRKGRGNRLTSCPPGSENGGPALGALIPNYCATFGWRPFDGGPVDEHSSLNHIDNEIYGAYAETTVNFRRATLTYIPSYRKVHQDNFTFSTSTFTSPLAGGDYVHVGSRAFDGENDLQSHELRLSSPGSSALTWVAGLIYLEDKLQDFRNSVGNLPISGPANVPGIRAFSQERKHLQTKSSAAFGQATYSMTDSFRVTAGVRYTEDDKKSRGVTNVIQSSGAVLPVPGDGDLSSNKVTWRVGLDYDLTVSSMLYGSVSTGYKAGGFNPGIQPNLFAPETITAYEVGSKNELLDRRLRLNLTAFYYDYTNYQFQFFGNIQIPNPTGGTPITLQQSVTAPAEKVKTKGVELESAYRLWQDTSVDFNATYLDAEFSKFIYTGTDYSGNTLPFAPDLTITAGIEHTLRFQTAGNLKLRLQTQYNSRQNAFYYDAPGSIQPSYTRTDATIGYTPSSDRYRVSAWIRNIEDDAHITQYLTQSPYNPASATVAPPRTYGLSVEVNFW